MQSLVEMIEATRDDATQNTEAAAVSAKEVPEITKDEPEQPQTSPRQGWVDMKERWLASIRS